jgi:hypothetical protein
MNRICQWFDRFQDGELDPDEQHQFKQHLISCDSCRSRGFLLKNIAQSVKNSELPEPQRDPVQISRNAFERTDSWDSLSFYWPKPAKVWAAFAAMAILITSFWFLPSRQETGISAEYEMFLTDSDLSNANQNILTAPTDDEIVRWLEEGGEIQ